MFFTSLDNYNTQKENTQTALKVYNRALIKFKEGLIGGTELTQIQNQYFMAETDYYTSINGLITAKAKLDNMTGRL
ncbi:MAG: TolC family protein [Bacteroidales bacterium]|nr:TolC family protein [Bacteroidales bacterium]